MNKLFRILGMVALIVSLISTVYEVFFNVSFDLLSPVSFIVSAVFILTAITIEVIKMLLNKDED